MGKEFLALDLGAESGRAVVGTYAEDRVSLEEVHRFANGPVRVGGGLYWDALGVFREVAAGLALAGSRGAEIGSMGVDSWGVDFGLLDRDGELLGNPRHYRDSRTEGMVEEAHRRVAPEDLYRATGVQTMRINTLYQLLAMEGTAALEAAEDLLMMPDLLGYWLTGEKVAERTNASTTQLFDPLKGEWSREIVSSLGIPQEILRDVVEPGTRVGDLLPHLAREAAIGGGVPVVAVASHDTASAVVAVPAEGEDFAYISSGTWSLVGVETEEPVITEASYRENFTNEGGFGGKNRFLKNVMGLWILQQCRKEWASKGKDHSYEELVYLARQAEPLDLLIDPDHPSFLSPQNMPLAVREYLRATGQEPAEDPGRIARCVLDSLALKYRWVLKKAAELSGKEVRAIHVVGGGSRNRLLCRITADATGLPVVAGPAEATALGNVMAQAHAAGEVGTLPEIREVVRRSVEPEVHEPDEHTAGAHEEAYGRFLNLLEESAPAKEGSR